MTIRINQSLFAIGRILIISFLLIGFIFNTVINSDDSFRKQNENVTTETYEVPVKNVTKDVHNLYKNWLTFFSERARLQEQSNYEAMHDQLTGLPNQKQLIEQLQHITQAKPGNNKGL